MTDLKFFNCLFILELKFFFLIKHLYINWNFKYFFYKVCYTFLLFKSCGKCNNEFLHSLTSNKCKLSTFMWLISEILFKTYSIFVFI